MEYLVICDNTTNNINMFLLIVTLKKSLWWLFYLQSIKANVANFWDTLKDGKLI